MRGRVFGVALVTAVLVLGLPAASGAHDKAATGGARKQAKSEWCAARRGQLEQVYARKRAQLEAKKAEFELQYPDKTEQIEAKFAEKSAALDAKFEKCAKSRSGLKVKKARRKSK